MAAILIALAGIHLCTQAAARVETGFSLGKAMSLECSGCRRSLEGPLRLVSLARPSISCHSLVEPIAHHSVAAPNQRAGRKRQQLRGLKNGVPVNIRHCFPCLHELPRYGIGRPHPMVFLEFRVTSLANTLQSLPQRSPLLEMNGPHLA
jgi:hypothetical protein